MTARETVAASVRLTHDKRRRVDAYATANGISYNAAMNVLVSIALNEIDAAAAYKAKNAPTCGGGC